MNITGVIVRIDGWALSLDYMNRTQFLLRRQATFGIKYKFGSQTSQAFLDPEQELWPVAVQLALEDARLRSSAPETLGAVHVNWYPDGKAGVGAHKDDESIFIKNMPIYSYTLLSDPTRPRGFQIYRDSSADPKQALYDVSLGHGDLLVMAGNMQDRYKHGVKSTTAKRFSELRRVNLTVRSIHNNNRIF